VWRVNAVLAGAGVELRLSERGEDEGRLVHTPLDPRSELPNVVLAAANSTTERARLEHAIVRFRSRHATRETKRDAYPTVRPCVRAASPPALASSSATSSEGTRTAPHAAQLSRLPTPSAASSAPANAVKPRPAPWSLRGRARPRATLRSGTGLVVRTEPKQLRGPARSSVKDAGASLLSTVSTLTSALRTERTASSQVAIASSNWPSRPAWSSSVTTHV